MNNIYRIIIFLLLTSIAACSSSQLNLLAADDEDRDIGLGGTGLLANTGNTADDNGLGGTGILGVITGFGSIFVNGIEIEYDDKTTFTVNGKPAKLQQLKIGDVVEVLTVDLGQHTQAQIINLRHEVIGKVEAVDPQTFSFTVQGQTVIQSVDKKVLPAVGTTVAVSGFRVDKTTIVSSRVKPVDAGPILLRTFTELPFKDKTTHWLVQMHVQDDQVVFQRQGTTHAVSVKSKTKNAHSDRLGIKILQLQKFAPGQLKLKQIVEPTEMLRGKGVLIPMQRRGGTKLYKPMSEAMPGSGPGPRQLPYQGQGPSPAGGPKKISIPSGGHGRL